MAALRDEPAFIEHDDAVGIAHRRKAMRNGKRRAGLGELAERCLNECLAFGIERARRFIKEQDGRIAQDRAGDRDALALAAGESQAAEQAIKSAGGKLEAFYFAFGDRDALIIVDAPDHATIAAASIAVNASGGVHAKTVVLLTPEEMDAAAKKGVKYTPPGH